MHDAIVIAAANPPADVNHPMLWFVPVFFLVFTVFGQRYRRGRFSWKVFEDVHAPYLLVAFINAFVWFGFFGAVVFNLLVLFHLSP